MYSDFHTNPLEAYQQKTAYNIIFYEKPNGESDLWNFLEKLRKKTQKTPRREIEKAKSERDDYLSRKES